MLSNSILKVILIIDGKKTCRQTIPESSYARKETVDIEIFKTSKNGDGKIIHYIKITGEPPSRTRIWNHFNQFR